MLAIPFSFPFFILFFIPDVGKFFISVFDYMIIIYYLVVVTGECGVRKVSWHNEFSTQKKKSGMATSEGRVQIA